MRGVCEGFDRRGTRKKNARLRTALQLLVPSRPREELDRADDGVDERDQVRHVDFEHHDQDEVDADSDDGLEHARLDDLLEDVEEDLEDGVRRVEQEDGGRR